MSYRTFGQVKAEVQRDLDLEDEFFIQAQEFVDYCQRAVDFCEAEIHKLGLEDQYFETVAPLILLEGKQEYALPSNMYASKITRIISNKETEIYDIERVTRMARYTDIAITRKYGNSPPYRYQMLNPSPQAGPRIVMVPTVVDTVAQFTPTATLTQGSAVIVVSSATGLAANQFVTGTGIPDGTRVQSVSGLNVTLSQDVVTGGTPVDVTFTDPDYLIYYIRTANTITADTDLIDVPEFDDFVVQFMKVECLKKETGNPRLTAEIIRLGELKAQMIETLTNMVPDEQDKLEPDFSFEMEMA